MESLPSVKAVSKVSRIHPTWTLGRLYEVEQRNIVPQMDEYFSFYLEDGDVCFVVKNTQAPYSSVNLSPLKPVGASSLSSPVKLMKTTDSGTAIFEIGQKLICKVKPITSISNRGIEYLHMKWAREVFEHIRVPQPLIQWVDEVENLSFIIMERLHGKTLDEARFENPCFEQGLDHLAKYLAADVVSPMASTKTSRTLRTIDSRPIVDKFLVMEHLSEDGTAAIGPLGFTECRNKIPDVMKSADYEFEFRLYHPQLIPSHIIITGPSEKPCIISWEHFGYYPMFWICTRLHFDPQFLLSVGGPIVTEIDRRKWINKLSASLEARGWPNRTMEWHNTMHDYGIISDDD